MKNEKIFPILRKWDMIWSANVDMTFCELYKEILKGADLNDKELTQLLSKYIDDNNIKT